MPRARVVEPSPLRLQALEIELRQGRCREGAERASRVVYHRARPGGHVALAGTGPLPAGWTATPCGRSASADGEVGAHRYGPEQVGQISGVLGARDVHRRERVIAEVDSQPKTRAQGGDGVRPWRLIQHRDHAEFRAEILRGLPRPVDAASIDDGHIGGATAVVESGVLSSVADIWFNTLEQLDTIRSARL